MMDALRSWIGRTSGWRIYIPREGRGSPTVEQPLRSGPKKLASIMGTFLSYVKMVKPLVSFQDSKRCKVTKSSWQSYVGTRSTDPKVRRSGCFCFKAKKGTRQGKNSRTNLNSYTGSFTLSSSSSAMAEASRIFYSPLVPNFRPLQKTHSTKPYTASFRRHSINCSVSTSDSARVAATGPIPWGCEIDSLENASALQKWLSQSGLPDQKMAIQRVDVGERGLVALKNVRKGEKLLFVPPSLVISADSEWSCPEAGEMLKRNSVPDWPLIATYLISEASLMKSSRWNNYISALPRQPYSLLYWTREELDRYLEASEIRERAIERITNVVGTYNDLRDRIFSKYPELFPEEVFNIETFKWSFGILFSRLVRLPSMDGKVALVPWADMLNHNCEVETFLDYDKSSQGVVFTTDRAYQPGEQVFISYGKKSNGELLLSYGFVPKEGSNPSDSVELLLSLKKSDKCYKEKLEALKKHGLRASQCFPIQITGWPLELKAFAYLAVSPPSMSKQFEEMAAAASNKSTATKDLNYPDIEEEALQFILDSCETSISKYNKFLQASGSMDLDVTSPKQLNRRVFLKQLAVDLCTSERRILFRSQYILRRRLRDLRSGELRALKLFRGFGKLFK
ncbi:ribulose-1,5 bisphosphate carboxylase/oxygenase large subunit N-methyltransferase, chloroplastic [Cucurbita pepo subsp. pepo]|uniref:ribulose-1,5 bisphosphate carboxylase/oxygenase large subunit N-methyltransferase, chloroplastic n=1 Tax=Cucurbita pepo subsp. pepo TaxID=3664 RepID=UPI000C9D8168|nr:ribulose-1,5 bisphosphate carboxylase/oxygenase large subunit N-methyltransferase, chloroplastic [Cucurbita pepo subsp. pepo]XP_023554433.1 ribulose-1,5 bisphosphate carboxylase/oxygenase large subunit N-methyltransferase, chloroplastic [Cucurbita pepo subsp. pepo]